jgi:hypothetical protein
MNEWRDNNHKAMPLNREAIESRILIANDRSFYSTMA